MRLATFALACFVATSSLAGQSETELERLQRVLGFKLNDETGRFEWTKRVVSPCELCEGAKQQPCNTCGEVKIDGCIECGGDRKADCRACAGTGEAYDPITRVVCTLCSGTAGTTCMFCGGRGRVVFESNPGSNKCMCCDAKGQFKCSLCNGKRWLPGPTASGRDLRKADAATLTTLIAEIDGALAIVKALSPDYSNDTKAARSVAAMTAVTKEVLPSTANAGVGVRKICKSLAKSQAYVGHDLRIMFTCEKHRLAVNMYLEHARKCAEFALKVHEVNESLERDGAEDRGGGR